MRKMKEQVKVLFIGPKDSGKSALANYIADAVQVMNFLRNPHHPIDCFKNSKAFEKAKPKHHYTERERSSLPDDKKTQMGCALPR